MYKKYFLLCSVLLAIYNCSNRETEPSDSPSDSAVDYTLAFTEPEFQVGENLPINYFNDITVGVINYSENNIKLITAANTETVILEGQNLRNINTYRTVLRPTILENSANSDAIDYNYIGLGQVIKAKDNKLYGLYHAEWHDGSILPANIAGFYASVGLCVSTDNGASFSKSSKAIIPNVYDRYYNNNAGDGGYGEPSLTFNADSTAVYSYFVDHNRTGKGVNISMAKFNVLSNGTPDFENCFLLDENNQFTRSVVRPAQIVTGIMGESDAIFPHVTYNKSAKKYFMVYTLNAYKDYFNLGKPSLSGTYLRTSNDGVNWTNTPTKLMTDYAIPFGGGNSFTWHPTIIYTKSDQSEGYLLYSKSNGIAAYPHKMWARKFKISQVKL